MNAVTTGLAKAKYEEQDHQVKIVFDGWATRESFQETLDIILEVGLINRTNQWLLNCEKLKGLKQDYIIYVLIQWMKDAYEKMIIYGVKEKSELSIISNNNLRKFTVAVKKAKNNQLIPHWITIRVYQEESKLPERAQIRLSDLEIVSLDKEVFTIDNNL